MEAVNDQVFKMDIIERILKIKRTLGKELMILTHHYQHGDVVDLGDYRGDSFGLSRTAAEDKDARFIIFCGVYFMAESAAILAKPKQKVQIPDIEAGCWMADMADSYIVKKGWNEVVDIAGEGSVMPLVYMNSDAEIKAHCGSNGGAVCTSSNAYDAFKWAFTQREKIFFFPDEHLGRNTGNQMGIRPEEMIVWDPAKPLGGNTNEDINNARVILWKGYCLVHTRFNVDQILSMRKKIPDAKIVVHPECTQEVVALADAVGSTSYIVKYVDEAPKGETIIIGTEINLIKRLGLEYPDKNILTLHDSICPNMHKITVEKLLWTLENIGQVNLVVVEEDIKMNARKALDRMLALP
jgi:quinolinate synthase